MIWRWDIVIRLIVDEAISAVCHRPMRFTVQSNWLDHNTGWSKNTAELSVSRNKLL